MDIDDNNFSLLLTGSLKPYTGNSTTLYRLLEIFQRLNINSVIKEVEDINRDSINSFSLIVALHAWHCRKILENCPLPYVLIFGGTDINMDINDLQRRDIICSIVNNAVCVVAFDQFLLNIAKDKCKQWKKLSNSYDNTFIIPQSVLITHIDQNFFLREYLNLPENAFIFIMVSSIRPVKDIFYLHQVIKDYHHDNPLIYMVVFGPILDHDYFEKITKKLSSCSCFIIREPLPNHLLYSAIQQSNIFVNSSLSEGMSSALLEAFALKTPVIARSNKGNNTLITHNFNGLLFQDPLSFIEQAKRLLVNPVLKDTLTNNAFMVVQKDYNFENEKISYQKLINKIKFG